MSIDVEGAWSGGSAVGINGIEEIGADEVALDQVAPVVGMRHRDADGEAVDDQPAEDAVVGIDHEAAVHLRESGCRRR